MLGAGVEPPAPPSAAAARLVARGVRPRRISAKRSWPPGCGRVPAPPPLAAAGGDGEKGADGRADEVVAPAAVPPAAQNGAPDQQGKDKVEEAAAPAAVPPAAQNSAPHQQGKDEVEEAAALTADPPAAQKGAPHQPEQSKVEVAALSAAVPPAAQNGALPQQGQNKVEVASAAATSLAAQNSAPTQKGQDKVVEAVNPVAIPPEECNGIISHALPQQGQETTGEEGDRVENGKAGSLINGADAASLDGHEGNMMLQVEVPVLSAPDSGIAGAGTSAQNSDKGAALLLAEEGHDGSGGMMLDEVSGDGYDREMRNRTDGGEIETDVDVVQGSRKKRWLMSAVNPPPKRRAVSAVRRFPPGCGRAAVTTKGSGVSAIRTFPPGCERAAVAISTFPPGRERAAVATDGSGVLEVSPVRAFPPDGGRVAVTPDGSAVLEVSPIRSYPPGRGRAAVTTIDRGDEERMPAGATPVANGDASSTEALAAVPISGGAASEKVEGKRVVGEGSSKAHNKIQESPVASYISPADIVGANQGSDQLPNVVTKVLPKHGFAEKMKGNISTLEGKQVVQVAGGERSKLDGSLRKDVSKIPMSRAIGANANGKRSDGDNMNVTLLDNAKASNEKSMQRTTLSTKKEPVHSNANMKQDKFALKLKVDGISKNTSPRSTESKKGKHVATNQIEENDEMDLVPDQIIVQALMAPDKCPWTQRKKSIVSASKSLAPHKRSKGKDAAPRKQLSLEVVSSELINDETIDDNEDPYMEDEENSRALILYDEKRVETEFTANLLPSVPSGSHHGQSGGDDVDARRKVRKLLQKFQLLCRKFMQVEEQGTRKVGRIDIAASNTLKKDPTYTKPGPILGSVPGVEVGDEFHFRVELSIIGLHRPIQPGIDSTTINGVPVAISIVASGGYPDELSSSDELIYTGSGGKAAGKKEAEDQKLVRGNLALKNCIEAKTPVRVIHGFKGQSRGEVAHSKSKQVSTFTYDGLYNVVECWQAGQKGSMVFKYRLRRIPGQPQLALHLVKVTKKSKVREGLLLPDISQGRERIPICVINTIDGLMPAPFEYVTKIIYPPWYKKEPPTGCDCTNGCSDSVKCACAVKNGGEIPYNFNGAIVEAKPLIYECGPSCRCPPTCHNRVSQHGVKIPLEIFKTGNRGWGVRSLSSIPSGSFICEYAGELLQDKEAEKRENDEYLFDIGHNYHDEELWEGLKSTPGLESSAPSSKPMEGFTIDAAECGNVGRFINHSCLPNLYAQNVLWDHDDVQKPHVMLFAVENIPPLQELTYHYNYTIGQVEDKNGEEKVKHCYCGSAECCGRLY
ncbi:hypothetical protein EJB05_42776, partial [Eragrostis curvula]